MNNDEKRTKSQILEDRLNNANKGISEPVAKSLPPTPSVAPKESVADSTQASSNDVSLSRIPEKRKKSRAGAPKKSAGTKAITKGITLYPEDLERVRAVALKHTIGTGGLVEVVRLGLLVLEDIDVSSEIIEKAKQKQIRSKF